MTSIEWNLTVTTSSEHMREHSLRRGRDALGRFPPEDLRVRDGRRCPVGERLPVIPTCGECGHHETFDDGRTEHSCSHGQRGDFVGRVDPDKPPPSWCPLRTGPDEAELEALRAVAEAARSHTEVMDVPAGNLDTIQDVAHDDLRAALRRLDEVRRG